MRVWADSFISIQLGQQRKTMTLLFPRNEIINLSVLKLSYKALYQPDNHECPVKYVYRYIIFTLPNHQSLSVHTKKSQRATILKNPFCDCFNKDILKYFLFFKISSAQHLVKTDLFNAIFCKSNLKWQSQKMKISYETSLSICNYWRFKRRQKLFLYIIDIFFT